MNTVQKGNVLIYRLFDVAHEIDLDAAARAVQRSETRRLTLERFAKAQLSISAPPLSFDMGERRLAIDGAEYTFESQARVFDFGVVSIIMRAAIASGTTLEALVLQHAQLADHVAVERLARELLGQVFDDLSAAMKKPVMSGFFEDYTVIYVERFAEPTDVHMLAREPTLARLLLGEAGPRPLAPEALENTVETSFSYYADELVVIDWNSAFIYDPSGDVDISGLVEFASAQLLELRYYDDLLDRELGRMYDEVARVSGLFRQRQYRALTRRLLQVVLEVTELTEKIENSLKWVGDLYLARVYQGAATQFNLPRWQAQVERKLNMVRNTAELLSDQISTNREFFLEASVVFLIVLELLLAFAKH